MSDEWGAGPPDKWSDHGSVMIGRRRYPLIWGEHPHSRSDNNHYVKIRDGGDDEPIGFSGHRILIDVHLTSSNYLKSSGLSGDEVRKGGTGQIIADGEVVFEFFFRDIHYALRKADQLITELSEHSSGWLLQDQREALIGRAVFYRDIPAVITDLVTDQGCVMLQTADGKPFPPPVWSDDEDYYEGENRVKVEVTDPHIWWHRKP
jgi:hypothetical protein